MALKTEITITYEWWADGEEEEISPEMRELLDEDAEQYIFQAHKEGFREGVLSYETTDDNWNEISFSGKWSRTTKQMPTEFITMFKPRDTGKSEG